MGSTKLKQAMRRIDALAERKRRRAKTAAAEWFETSRRQAAEKEREQYLAQRTPQHVGHIGGRSERFDCCYCLTCNVWKESGCSDPTCHYCKDRPATPQDAINAGLLVHAD